MRMKNLGKALCSYGNKITPRNWNVYDESQNHKSVSGVLNIRVVLVDTTPSERLQWEKENGVTMPTALTRALTYKKISQVTEKSPYHLVYRILTRDNPSCSTEPPCC